jgi:fibrillarin-like pre-rRNA processing protein
MKKSEINNVYREGNQIFTRNLEGCKGLKVYNEKVVRQKGVEFRSWNPYRSKLAAAILNGLNLDFKPDYHVLYLGAATGTTVSHVSDIAREGCVFAVENSAFSMKKFLQVMEHRTNVVPILHDAFHPDRYSNIVSLVDLVYQDISQRNQAEIFIGNVNRFLKKHGNGVLMVKARSVDVSLKPEKVYDMVEEKLVDNGLKVLQRVDLGSYEKGHACFYVAFSK